MKNRIGPRMGNLSVGIARVVRFNSWVVEGNFDTLILCNNSKLLVPKYDQKFNYHGWDNA